MRHRQCAAFGAFVALTLTGHLTAAQAQGAWPPPSNFDKRFYYEPEPRRAGVPAPEQIRDRLKELLISPAQAHTPVVPPAVPDVPEVGQTAKNSSLRKAGPERP